MLLLILLLEILALTAKDNGNQIIADVAVSPAPDGTLLLTVTTEYNADKPYSGYLVLDFATDSGPSNSPRIMGVQCEPADIPHWVGWSHISEEKATLYLAIAPSRTIDRSRLKVKLLGCAPQDPLNNKARAILIEQPFAPFEYGAGTATRLQIASLSVHPPRPRIIHKIEGMEDRGISGDLVATPFLPGATVRVHFGTTTLAERIASYIALVLPAFLIGLMQPLWASRYIIPTLTYIVSITILTVSILLYLTGELRNIEYVFAASGFSVGLCLATLMPREHTKLLRAFLSGEAPDKDGFREGRNS